MFVNVAPANVFVKLLQGLRERLFVDAGGPVGLLDGPCKAQVFVPEAVRRGVPAHYRSASLEDTAAAAVCKLRKGVWQLTNAQLLCRNLAPKPCTAGFL